ncbi:MAG: hypothetical protein AVDCRST_MAG10-1712, partial [uncultured Acidimicrobiales bacterium]
ADQRPSDHPRRSCRCTGAQRPRHAGHHTGRRSGARPPV